MADSVSGPAAKPVEVVFGLGANLGDRRASIERALGLLATDCGPLTRSSLYATPPWGDVDQPAFLNVVARGETRIAPLALLRRCKEIEQELGRVPSRHWGPRAIDVDLLAYGRVTLTTTELQLPHPRLHERGFVLVPLAEIEPDWRHPLLDLTATELRDALAAEELVGIKRWEG